MRRHILGCVVGFGICLVAAPAARAEAKSPAGHWEGAFVRLNSMQAVAVDLVVDAQGVRGTYDIPDLGLYAEPLTEVAYERPTLRFELLYGRFPMHVHDEIHEMTGGNADWDPAVALHLKRVPSGPPPCVKEEVRFTNGAVTLAGTLVRPRTGGPHPAVVIVHGSGPRGRSAWEYRSLGDLFARRGIAALVYDKRGVGGSTGDLDAATFDDLAGDAAAAVELLRRRGDIDRRRIGMFGSSQGGWLAPLAASRLQGVAFLILDKGAAVDVREQEMQRVEYGLRADGFSEQEINEALDYTRQVFQVAYSGGSLAGIQAATKEAKDRKWAAAVQLAETDEVLEGWRLERYDPVPVLKRTRIPVLALFGEKDTLVPPDRNAEAMRRYLADAGNRDVTITIFPGQGHGRFAGQSLHGGRWAWPDSYWVWGKQAPEFAETVFSWLDERLWPAGGKPRHGG